MSSSHENTTAGKQFVRTCKILFEKADTDNSGGLDSEEFIKVLRSKALNLRLTREEIDEISKFNDKDGDGVITFDEFVPIVEQLFNRQPSKKAKRRGTEQPPKGPRTTWKFAKDMVSLTAGGKSTLASTVLAAQRQKLLEVRTKSAVPSPLEIFELRREGQKALNEDRFVEAQMIMEVAVKLAQKLKENSPQHLTCLGKLAKIVAMDGHHKRAAELYLEYLFRLKKVHGHRGSRQLVDCNFDLSKAFAAMSQFDDAKISSVHSITMLDQLTRNDSESVKDGIMTPYLEWHLSLLKKLNDKSHAVIKVQARLVGISIRKFIKKSKQSQNDMIRDKLKRELLSGGYLDENPTQNIGHAHATTAVMETDKAEALLSLGRMLIRQSRINEAEPLFRQAVALFEKTLQAMSMRLAMAYTTLAGCMAINPKSERRRNAHILLDRSANILFARGKELEAADFGGPLSIKVKFYELMQNYQGACNIMRRIHSILTEYLGQHHKKTELASLELKRFVERCGIPGQIKDPNRMRRAGRAVLDSMTIQASTHTKVFKCPDCGSREALFGKGLGSGHESSSVTPVCKNCFDSQVALMLSKQHCREKLRRICPRIWRNDIEKAKVHVGLQLGVVLLPSAGVS